MTLIIDTPRETARAILRDSVDADTWSRNEAFTRRLAEKIQAHRLFNHPVIDAFERKEFTFESMGMVHCEVRVALAQHFTDALIRLMQTTSELEARLGPRAKMAARFLLELNLLEELGFKPTSADGTGFSGHPGHAHYWQLADTLEGMGHPWQTWRDYRADAKSLEVRDTVLESMNDHLRLSILLAGIETGFIPYYGPWAINTLAVCGVDPDGYHSIHVADHSGTSVDKGHSEDSWFIVRQALTPARYAEAEAWLDQLLSQWAGWVDMLVAKNDKTRRPA